jgi:hypothetical protein
MEHRSSSSALLGAIALALAVPACVPSDEALGLGSVQFQFGVSDQTRDGVPELDTADYPPWEIQFDRIVLGFKTMTIGKIGVSDICSYRGRGATSDVAFDPRAGLVQTFNGLRPVECPDVGVIFGGPSNTTTLGNGVTSKDLVDLASDSAHAIIEANATSKDDFGGPPRSLRIQLRFEPHRTSTRFGGCRAQARGVRILEHERDEVSVRFAAEHLFRDSVLPAAALRVAPFLQADMQGDDDGIVTMDELDRLRLSSVFVGDYRIPEAVFNPSFGDYLRYLFRFTIIFRNAYGQCLGNAPGVEETTDRGGEP